MIFNPSKDIICLLYSTLKTHLLIHTNFIFCWDSQIFNTGHGIMRFCDHEFVSLVKCWPNPFPTFTYYNSYITIRPDWTTWQCKHLINSVVECIFLCLFEFPIGLFWVADPDARTLHQAFGGNILATNDKVVFFLQPQALLLVTHISR